MDHQGRSLDFYSNIELVIQIAPFLLIGYKILLDIISFCSFSCSEESFCSRLFCNAANANGRLTLRSKLAVGLSQAFFGSKVVKFKDTMTPPKLKINGRLYSVTGPVIDGLAYLNLSVIISVIVLLLSYSIYTTFDLDYCTAYSDCFRTEDYGDNYVRFNCSLRNNTEYDFENSYYVCYNLLFEPIKIISLLGGFLYIVPPLLFQIFDFIYLRIIFNRFCCRRLTIGQIRICTVPVVAIQYLVFIAYTICMNWFGLIGYPNYQSMVRIEKYQVEKWVPLVMAFFCYPQGLFTNYDDDITADYQQLQAPQNGINRHQQAQQNGINRQQQAQRNGANRQRQMQQNRNRSNRQHMPGQQSNNLDLQLPIHQRDNDIPLIRSNVRSGYGSQQNV